LQLRQTHNPVPCNQIGEGLEIIGEFLLQAGNPSILLGHAVSAIDYTPIDSGTGVPFTLHRGDAPPIYARVCILATGRKECMWPELVPWQHKVVLSSNLLKGICLPSALLPQGHHRRIAILGGSHGAFSVLEMLIDHVLAVGLNTDDLSIDIYHREEIALHYTTLEEARLEQVERQERQVDEERDVCPQTGMVFRDSGLRGRAKELFRNIRDGSLSYCRLHKTLDLRGPGLDFDRYDYVIQALGAVPNVPLLRVDRRVVWKGDGSDMINVGYDGNVVIDAPEGTERIPLFALRLVPTTSTDKNHRPDVQNVYARLAAAALRALR
jgi:hypothetical protein